MTIKELKDILSEYKDDSEVLISLDQEVTDENGNSMLLESGLNVFEDDELIYIGELSVIEEVDEDEE